MDRIRGLLISSAVGAVWPGASLPAGDNQWIKGQTHAAPGPQLCRDVAARYRRLIGAEAAAI